MDKAKEKSKDVSDSSATRRLGISVPRTDHDFVMKIGVDDIADLLDCSKKFEYGKDFLPHSLMEGVPGFMNRMHSWYTRACRLASEPFGLSTLPIFSDHKLKVSLISCSIFKTSKRCSASKN